VKPPSSPSGLTRWSMLKRRTRMDCRIKSGNDEEWGRRADEGTQPVTHAYPAPLRGEGGPPCAAGWWKGLLAHGLVMRAPEKTVDKARRLRRALSAPEARLWRRLREREPGKPIFRRQHPMGPYVLDFYCAKARLAIEIDGISHDMGDRPRRDTRRDSWLEAQGVMVVHVAAKELTNRIDEAVDAIVRMAQEML